jgi:hypothetical protein
VDALRLSTLLLMYQLFGAGMDNLIDEMNETLAA